MSFNLIQIAHVIFTSDNVTVSKPLAKGEYSRKSLATLALATEAIIAIALPNRPFNSVSLTDASIDVRFHTEELDISVC